MDWLPWLVAALVVGTWLALRRRGLIAPERARRLLQEGAQVIDVRSVSEFGAGHLPGAVNIPLGELSEAAPRQVPDRNAVLLLHCVSGGRSALAKHRLQALGYRNAFNLGSYARAERIIRQASGA